MTKRTAPFLFWFMSVNDIFVLVSFYILFFKFHNLYDLPTSDLFIVIFSNESRFHFTIGIGLPDARHLRLTFDPSRTITSLELNESSIFGGTKS